MGRRRRTVTIRSAPLAHHLSGSGGAGNDRVARRGYASKPSLVELDESGIVVYLGSRGRQLWTLLVDGVCASDTPLTARAREDILFLSGECAGLLFLRDLADGVVSSDAPDGDEPTDFDLS